jgi:hypothetical protein
MSIIPRTHDMLKADIHALLLKLARLRMKMNREGFMFGMRKRSSSVTIEGDGLIVFEMDDTLCSALQIVRGELLHVSIELPRSWVRKWGATKTLKVVETQLAFEDASDPSAKELSASLRPEALAPLDQRSVQELETILLAVDNACSGYALDALPFQGSRYDRAFRRIVT